MALDSIAKLAVVITGDESPLAASVNRAEKIVAAAAARISDPWARGLSAMRAMNDKWAAGLARLAEQRTGTSDPFSSLKIGAGQYSDAVSDAHQGTVQLSTVLSAMRGNIPAIFKVGGNAALPAVGILAIAAAAYKLADAGDTLMKDSGFAELDTWSGQWDRLKTSISTAAGAIGGPLATAFRDATEEAASLIDRFNRWAFPEQMNRLKQHLDEVAQKEREIADSARHAARFKEAQARAAKEARDIAQREEKRRDELSDFQRSNFNRADAIRDMVRTPAEELRRFSIELRSLFASGFIDQETMNRALEMAEQKARDAVSSQRGAASRANQSVGAAERFTLAGHTAVAEAQARQQSDKEQAQIARAQLSEEQKQVQLLQQIEVILRGTPNHQFIFGNLN